ncbi:hypothetical protein PN36_05940 [Candidatus Thiomargarita nelsonii]|uniref:Uncharacterized protein n=1 Tax=Candidatus Thiomargarita nelsonii TaxID=1003181 RepID=A0A4E0QRR4_9GAMM|nr:hypothetical protein PN36_05940 [Candidatus Thiomargarita nelsonii]
MLQRRLWGHADRGQLDDTGAISSHKAGNLTEKCRLAYQWILDNAIYSPYNNIFRFYRAGVDNELAIKDLGYSYQRKRDRMNGDASTIALQIAARAILAIWQRKVDRSRKRGTDNAPRFLPYANYFLAMLIGKLLLEKLNISLKQLDHQNFTQAKNLLEHSFQDIYSLAIDKLEEALKKLYGTQTIPLQRLAATFRRGDLLEFFHK